MQIYFSWVEGNQPLDIPENLYQEDLKIFKLTISQREGEVALAKAWIPPHSVIKNSWAIISCEDNDKKYRILFQGRPLGFPRRIDKDFLEIELSAEPFDAKQQLEEWAERLKVPILYDPLFIERGDQNPVNGLEARSELFYWDRCTGKVSLSNLFEGKREVDLSQYVLADTLSACVWAKRR